MTDKQTLVDMLKFQRKHGTQSHKDFCRKYLLPVFGTPDLDGNFVLEIGDKPKVCFTAHHDSVHDADGMQTIIVKNDVASLPENTESKCLGADCATGIWLMLGMIEAQVPGFYIVFAEEESGCNGSKSFVESGIQDYPDFPDIVISFDRKGRDSIVTRQCGVRTCSDEFANALGESIGLGMEPDPTGVYTDSESFADIIPECTNVSVGYYNQHTKAETQDLQFAETLLQRLIRADWQLLPIARDPSFFDEDYGKLWQDSWGFVSEKEKIANLIADFPDDIAAILVEYGMTYNDLADDIGFKAQGVAQ